MSSEVQRSSLKESEMAEQCWPARRRRDPVRAGLLTNRYQRLRWHDGAVRSGIQHLTGGSGGEGASWQVFSPCWVVPRHSWGVAKGSSEQLWGQLDCRRELSCVGMSRALLSPSEPEQLVLAHSAAGAAGDSMFKVPFAVLAAVDCKAQKGFFCLVGFFVVVEDWPESFVIIGAIWIVWKSSLSYWPCWGIIPDVFLYTAVKQEIDPKPKIDLNHCFVKNQNWTWIIVFYWLHWIQIIIGHSWIQPQLKANWKKHRLWPRFWIGETWKARSLRLVMGAANVTFMLIATLFYYACVHTYICLCIYQVLSCIPIYFNEKRRLTKPLLLNWKINDRLKSTDMILKF